MHPLFFEVYEALPRQGPGYRAATARALAMCEALPPSPSIVDLGCGSGAQTLDLAELSKGTVVAVDNHAPLLERLEANCAARGLAGRVRAHLADMANPGLPAASFDLCWSEGALYQVGIANALQVCRGLLKPGGCLAFTDAVWRKADPPAAIAASFAQDYPGMGTAADVAALIEQAGFELLGQFALPDAAWWDDFYLPMARQVERLRAQYAGNAEALSILAQIGEEPELHRQYSTYYGYEFFVARWPATLR